MSVSVPCLGDPDPKFVKIPTTTTKNPNSTPLLLPQLVGCGILGTNIIIRTKIKMSRGKSEPSQKTPVTSWAPPGLLGPTPAPSVERSSVQHKPSAAT